ncbi:MAG: ferrochelatase, partial [Proteobacteria bacterium]|nr:ferrochelatase [Pseudomonadota bacterium]
AVRTEELGDAGSAALHAIGLGNVAVDTAMRYGRPSIRERLETLKAAGVTKLLVLPLYPQYAAATTASIFDAVADTLRTWRHVPELVFVSDYHRDEAYIKAVSTSIADFWQGSARPSLLLFSFHGLPERSRLLGDPYYGQCLETAKMVAARLGLEDSRWRVVFQSRFGPAEWIKPYCVEVLRGLPAEGIEDVDVVCPGFAVDCLETLEEIAIANREIFLRAGGRSYRYIPALNSRSDHSRAIAALIAQRLGGG